MAYPNLTAEQLLRSLAGAEPTDAGLRERLDAEFKQHPSDGEEAAASDDPDGASAA